MSARFYPHVFIVLGADLTQLECATHLAIQFVLLRRHLYVLLRRWLYGPCQIWIYISTVWIQVAAKLELLFLLRFPNRSYVRANI